MKPTLTHKPNNYTYHKLLVNFSGGIPLSPEQLNFLSRHEKTLSCHTLDPVLKYYLKPFHQKDIDTNTFLMHRENFNAEAAKELKRRLNLLLKNKDVGKRTRVKVRMTAKQYMQFKNSASPSLIHYHGNQFITGAPFYLGGIPHVVFFQWGNLFGVAKYVVLADERALKSNVMIYFEDKHERFIEQFVDDFKKEMAKELEPERHHVNVHELEKQAPHENYSHSPFEIPKLSLSLNTEHKEEK